MSRLLFKPVDILVWLVLVAVTVISIAWMSEGESGLFVRIAWPNGTQLVGLGKDQTFSVEGRDGPVTIRISDGMASITESPCSRKICLNASAIGKVGQSIICIPEGVKLEIVDSKASYDTVIR